MCSVLRHEDYGNRAGPTLQELRAAKEIEKVHALTVHLQSRLIQGSREGEAHPTGSVSVRACECVCHGGQGGLLREGGI